MPTRWNVLGKKLLGSLIAAAFINLLIDVYQWSVPIVVSSGVVVEGSHLGVDIGSSKAQAVRRINNLYSGSPLKIVAFEVDGDDMEYVTFPKEAYNANHWILNYSGNYSEQIHIYFDESAKVYKIEFSRNLFELP